MTVHEREQPPALPKFQTWCDMERGRMALVARTLKVSAPAVSGWRSGISRPVEHFRPAIEQLTGGDVPAGDWELPSERARRDESLGRAEQATGTDGAA